MELGLLSFMNNNFLCDAVIKLQDKSFKVHKVVVAASSLYYYRLFENENKTEFDFPPYIEPKNSKTSLKEVFETVLKYIYSNQNPETLSEDLNESTASSYLAIGYSLGINSLIKLSCEYIINQILTPENSIDYLTEGIKYYSDHLLQASSLKLVKNFQALVKNPKILSEVMELPYKVIVGVVSSDELNVDNEKVVYDFLCAYFLQFKGQEDKKITPEEVLEIFAKIRWPFLTHSELLEAAANQEISICKDMVLEGLSVQLAEHIRPNDYQYKVIRTPRTSYSHSGYTNTLKKPLKTGELPIKFFSKTQNNWKPYGGGSFIDSSRPRPPQDYSKFPRRLEKEFVYSYDFDENGALYYLGSYGRSQLWENPHILGSIKVFSSSVLSGKLEDIAGRVPSSFKTKNEMNAYVGVDLGLNRALKVTAYSFRNGNSNSNMICWQFEGSNTGMDWVVIDRRLHSSAEDIKYLSEKGKSSTWGVGTCDRSYRYLRILQSDKNLASNYILSISCLEVYGIPTGNGWELT